METHLNSIIESDDHFVAVDAKMESDLESNADQDEDQLEGNENEWPVQVRRWKYSWSNERFLFLNIKIINLYFRMEMMSGATQMQI